MVAQHQLLPSVLVPVLVSSLSPSLVSTYTITTKTQILILRIPISLLKQPLHFNLHHQPHCFLSQHSSLNVVLGGFSVFSFNITESCGFYGLFVDG
uniref:Secreted protein n=1 Tax=Salix viminalis TaxID=40686 RepID=A0A6N2KI74_SALVM